MEMTYISSLKDADDFLKNKLTGQRRSATMYPESSINLGKIKLLNDFKLEFTVEKEHIEREIKSRPEGMINGDKIDRVIGLHFLLIQIPILIKLYESNTETNVEGLLIYDDNGFYNYGKTTGKSNLMYPEN